MKTGGQLIVEALKANGVKRVSCVPGESYLAVLDALYDSGIDVLVCRQEGGAAMMADCWGRLTGEPGICMGRAQLMRLRACTSPGRIRSR